MPNEVTMPMYRIQDRANLMHALEKMREGYHDSMRLLNHCLIGGFVAEDDQQVLNEIKAILESLPDLRELANNEDRLSSLCFKYYPGE